MGTPRIKKTKSTTGRHSKYTPELIKKVYDYVKIGMPYKYAAHSVGITEETFYTWRASKPEFSEHIERARAEFVLANLARIERKAPATWQAAAWLLERRCRADFGRQAIELSGINGKPIELSANVEHHGALAQRVCEDREAIDAHTTLLVRLGVRQPEPRGVRVVHDDGGERPVDARALPRGDKPGTPKRRRGKNATPRH